MMPMLPVAKLYVQPTWRPYLIVLGVLGMPLAAHAAPFCIQSQGLPAQCIYYDAGDCQKEANRQGAICSANPDEVHMTANVGQYCLITSQQVSLCIYSDRDTCIADAARQHGACSYAPEVAPSGAPDPYAAIGGR
jgi:hypothetical protein